MQFFAAFKFNLEKVGDKGVEELSKAMVAINQMQFFAAFELKLEPNRRLRC